MSLPFQVIIFSLTANIALLLFPNIANPQTQIVNNSPTLTKSNPIGRLLNGDRTKEDGSLIFPGDHIDPREEKVQILCYLNHKMLLLPKGRVDDKPNKCTQSKPQTNKANLCKIGKTCLKTKTTNTNAHIPALINPYSSVIQNPRPTISWIQTPNATSYIVIVEGNGIKWRKTTQKSTLLYPIGEPRLNYGDVYKLSIIANQGDYPVEASSNILIILPPNQVQKIQDTIQKIKSFNLPPEQETRDIEIVYSSSHLLTDSIELLKQEIDDAGSKDPTLYRLLGDRYLEAGLPQKAKSIYLKAIVLARKTNQSKEIELAQNQLKFIDDQLRPKEEERRKKEEV